MTQTEQTAGLSDIAARIWGEVGGPAELPGGLTATGPRVGAAVPVRRDRPGHGLGGGRDDGRGRVPRGQQRPEAAAGDGGQPPGVRGVRRRGPVHPGGVGAPGALGPDRRKLPGQGRVDPAAHQLRVPPRRRRATARGGRPRVGAGGGGGVEGRGARDRGRRGGRLRGGDAHPRGVAGRRRRARPPPARRWRPSPTDRCRRRGSRAAGEATGGPLPLLRRAGARPHPGHRRADRHQVPGRLRRRRAPDRPARIRRGARAAAGDDGGQADRRARPQGGGRPGGLRVPRRHRRRPGLRAARGRPGRTRLRRRTRSPP